jgi:hypothetical protein
MVETMWIKLLHWGALEWHYIPAKFHENLPNGSKDIHTWFTLKDSNTPRTFLPYSKQLALVAMVTLVTDCMSCNHDNPTTKQSQTIAVQGWKSCLQLTNLNLNHFKMAEDMGLKITAWGPLEWHHLLTKYHEDLPSSSIVISGGHTDKQIDTHRLVIS